MFRVHPAHLPLPERPPDTFGERLAKLRALLDRAEELRRRSDPLARLQEDLRRMERLLQE
jgi:hypothetical protein